MLMAARYRRGRNLTGPVIFPIYWQVLKLILGILTATNLASIGLLVVRGGTLPEVGNAVTRFFDNGLEAAVFITLVAALCEWSLSRFKVLERWDPGSMRSFGDPLRVAERHAQHAVMQAARAPAVNRLFPVIVIVAIVVVADQYVRLTRHAPSFVRWMRIVWANAGWVLVVLLALADHQWVVWVGTPDQWARFGALVNVAGRTWSLVDIVNASITTALVIVALASLIGPCWRLRRVFTRRGGAHTAHA
jgi:hypothetical protein